MLTLVPEEIDNYAAAHSTPLPALLEELVTVTREKTGERAQMLSGQLEGTLLHLLAASLGARRILEIGTFTGFSALMMAAALPEDGKLITCEINPEAIELARGFFARSPYGGKIEIREGPALDTLKALEGPFDLVFVDADKENLTAYYEAVLPLLSPNGVIAVNKVLWFGRVLDPQNASDRGVAAFNDHVSKDDRVTQVILGVAGDGVMLIRPS